MTENIEDDLFVELQESHKNDANIEFRYSRQTRLEKAPSNVKLLYKEDYIKKGSIFSCLINNKGNRAIFIVICVLVILNLGLYFYYHSSNTGKIEGINVEVDNFVYNGDLLVNVSFSENKRFEKEEQDVKVLLKAFNKNGEEIYVSESKGVYIGSKLMLHFKTKNEGITNIKVSVLINGKTIILSKNI